jgi:ABC transport system ATP-binding/permease protein
MSQTNAKLVIHSEGQFFQDLWLNETIVTIGRAPDNLLCLSDDLTVSRHHAQIALGNGVYLLTDVGSSDGTYLNQQRVQAYTPHQLKDGDEILIGAACQFTFKATEAIAPVAPPASTNLSTAEKTTILPFDALPVQNLGASQRMNLRGRDVLNIGRDPTNDLVIDHPSSSRFHSQIKLNQGNYTLYDLNSTNGTFINGELISGSHALKVGDTIRIGPTQLVFNVDETLIKTNDEGNLRIDALNLNKVVAKGLNLLNDISLSIQPREFVAIAGVSGGGKSTLLDALNGFRPATSGNVYVNGIDLYKNFNAYRTEIGYVPQKDIVHMELTVEDALLFAAKLRMPADTTAAERHQRVEEVMRELMLTQRRDLQIKALSGGQLKRVSIGVELLTKPSLFFLDEATSGLDPGMESELMQLLRELADQGRTILLITHATENVMLCDQVIFMARGGNLAFFGPPQDALKYFEVQRFNEIYRKVENERSPEEWKAQYLQSPYFHKYIGGRQKSLNILEDKRGAQKRERLVKSGAHIKRASSFRQFMVLSQRNLAILARDRISLALMLAVAPLLGLFDFVAWPRTILNIKTGNPSLAISMLFTSVLIAIMVGSLATMREIVKEIDIFKRERMIGIRIMPYVLSKVWVALLLSFYQAVIFVLFKCLAVELPLSLGFIFGMFLTMLLTTMGGMMMGLLGSAISPNQSVAPMIVLLLLIPQILFGGGVLPIETFGPPGKVLNTFALTKWPFETLVTLTGFGTDVARDKCWIKLGATKDLKISDLSAEEKKDCKCVGTPLFKNCTFPGIRSFYVPELDKPEPIAPAKPELSNSVSLVEQQEDMKVYEDKMKVYQDDIKDWNLKTSRAISEAEGNINGLFKKFKQAFDVPVQLHLTIYSFFVLGMLALTVVAQKVKDFI